MQDILGEFEGLLLPDKRLVDRVMTFVTACWRVPAASFPKMLEDIANLQGGYRLLNNKRVTFDSLHSPHRARTIERAQGAGDVVVVHDTTNVKTPYALASEVGYLNTGQAGYRAHVSLVQCVESGRPVRPLGVLSVQTAFRSKPSKRSKKHSSGATTARWKGKESERWGRGVAIAAEALKECERVVHVMDREADCYPLFSQIQQLEHGFVIRLRNDRRARHDDDDEELWSSLGQLATEMQGVFVRDVPLSSRGAKTAPASLKNHPPREARVASLNFSAAPVEISKPRYLTAEPASLHLMFVRVWEPEPPEGEKPVEWLLLTNEPCETPEEIARVVDLYRSRWTIEDFFKALKTGCALEDRQLESRHALLNTLALFLPIAVHLLWIRTCARDVPDADATEVFTPLQLTVLRHRSRRRLPENPTAKQALWALAGIGGHIPNNGWPGWQVLGRALTTLLEAVEIWQLAMRVAGQAKM
jgi:hypothetical protein